MNFTCDIAVIGGGIVGLATAKALVESSTAHSVILLEKESALAQHQTGRNSGVIHSGIYYPPGSLKARTCIAGSHSIVEYARRHGVAVEVTGKLIAATRPDELPGLDRLYERGLDHGLEVRKLDASEAREFEPHLAAIAAVHVPSTGVVDYVGVARAMAEDIRSAGGQILLGAEVTDIVSSERSSNWRVETTVGEVEAVRVVNCGGLHSDEIASLTGTIPSARIVPFRGEYFELRPEAAHLVRGLIYPVPDPDFPFLGVHLTRGFDGSVHAGPNAVLALRREGYRWRDINAPELLSTLKYSGFRQLAKRNLRQGLAEMRRSVWKPLFVHELQRLVPEITAADLVRSAPGVRAQAVGDNGELIDDFLIEESPPRSGDSRSCAFHVLNAPSPAATASLEIGAEIARRLEAA